ncbi:NYN domain-containing protein [Kineococcus sp. NUM-3379]
MEAREASVAAGQARQDGPELDLLVWDAPNIDMTLSSILGSRPSPSSRPRFDALARWFLSGAGEREVEGCVFTNVQPASALTMRGWIEALRGFGYAVFARPKLQADDDVDEDMLRHIAERRVSHRLTRLVVASGDGRNFLQPLEALAREGVHVTVLSFAEVAGYAQESEHIEFVDLEDVPGAFQFPLGRTRLTALPPGGGWFRPTRPMRALLEEPHAPQTHAQPVVAGHDAEAAGAAAHTPQPPAPAPGAPVPHPPAPHGPVPHPPFGARVASGRAAPVRAEH